MQKLTFHVVVCTMIFALFFALGERHAKSTEKAEITSTSTTAAATTETATRSAETTATEAETTTRAEYMLLNVVATAYCPCKQCSEGYGRNTATGATATSQHTIAVDPSVIPYGTHVIINGCEYVAEDCGGAIKGNRIDIFFDTHEEAEAFGRQQLQIKVLL